jgi:hypothetical protein
LKSRYDDDDPCEGLCCKALERKDRLHVIYKLTEYPDRNA